MTPKQLYITNIGEATKFEPRLGQDTRIALKSLSIRGSWLNVFYPLSMKIFKQIVDATTGKFKDVLEVHIKIEEGLYSIEDIASIINTQAGVRLTVFILRNGKSRIRVNMGYTARIDRTLRGLFGLDYDLDIPFPAGDYDGKYRTDIYPRLRLKCEQLDQKHSLFNGNESDLLALLPTPELPGWGGMLTWSFDTPVYLPLKGSADKLTFMLADDYHDRNILFKDLTMHILLE